LLLCFVIKMAQRSKIIRITAVCLVPIFLLMFCYFYRGISRFCFSSSFMIGNQRVLVYPSGTESFLFVCCRESRHSAWVCWNLRVKSILSEISLGIKDKTCRTEKSFLIFGSRKIKETLNKNFHHRKVFSSRESGKFSFLLSLEQ
jgi:hypothetical protein